MPAAGSCEGEGSLKHPSRCGCPCGQLLPDELVEQVVRHELLYPALLGSRPPAQAAVNNITHCLVAGGPCYSRAWELRCRAGSDLEDEVTGGKG